MVENYVLFILVLYNIPNFVADKNTDMLREKKVSMIEERLQETVAECLAAGLSIEDIHDIIDVIGEEIKK